MTSQHIALITGGNRGLGRAAALAVAAAGTDVVFTYRSDPAEAADVVAELERLGRTAVALRLDTTAFDTFAGFAEQLARTLGATWNRDSLDYLLNNAGVAGMTPLGGTSAGVIDALVDVHFKGVVLLTQELAPLIADGGRILNVSTGLTRFVGSTAFSVYASVKGAVEVYTRYLAKELGPRRIAVNAIAPGATATDFGGGVIRDNDQYRTGIAAVSAMGRVGEPDDIGAAVAALLTDGTGWITGQRIEASGGQAL